MALVIWMGIEGSRVRILGPLPVNWEYHLDWIATLLKHSRAMLVMFKIQLMFVSIQPASY